ncbi:T9SS type A sorting domain-containing protein [Flavobacterium sp. MAH-1]|uniref:T9SS type A sorting domain-containing protein n=1 Tax=Flavobacterium agri TaxID=2743471 RepID=A0A7Y8Y3S2_9FLAO|nr:T9SS type A sorting domain-containing protein [Flavobacterium agri]NUY82014.1 T9SS type A sorting domain-containing protein [Flavobacterium agri]NYA72038.1 T9SS type A sorting domain-containing protein [Flavobacterium agri]
MKKITLFLLLFVQSLTAQIWTASEMLCPKLRESFFFDENHGFSYGEGTIISTSDGGANWIKCLSLVDAHESQWEAEKISDNRAIIFTHHGNFYRTLDKGLTWTLSTLGFTGNEKVLFISFVSENIGFISGELTPSGATFLAKTVDGGQSWNLINNNVNSGTFGVKFISPTVGFTLQHYPLQKTTDGGSTWTNVTFPANIVWQIQVAENGILCAFTTTNKMYASYDQGSTWTILNGLTPANNVYLDLYDFSIKNNILLVPGFVNDVSSLIKYDLISNTIQSVPFPLMTPSCITHFLDEDFAVTTRRGGNDWQGSEILSTNNGGLNWSSLESSFFPAGGFGLRGFKTESGRLFYGGMDDMNQTGSFRIFESESNGAAWHPMISVPTSSGTFLRVKDNYMSYMTQGSNSWVGNFVESTDAGQSWTSHEIDELFIDLPTNPERMTQIDNNTLFYNGFGNKVYYSTNHGVDWTQILAPVYISVGAKFHFDAAGTMYLFEYNQNVLGHVLYRSQDWGQSWQTIATIPGNNTQYLIAYSDDFAIVKESVGASAFKIDLVENTTSPYPMGTLPNGNNFYQLYLITPQKWCAGGATWSYDAGQTWMHYNNFISYIDSNSTLDYDPETDELVFANDSGMVRLSQFVPESSVIIGENSSQTDQTLQYIVPFNPFADVEWQLSSGGYISSTDENRISIHWISPGTHILSAKYVNENGQSSYFSLEIIVTGSMGVDQPQTQNVMINPNPVRDNFEVKLPDVPGQDVQASIYDSAAHKICDLRLQSDINKISEMQHVASGVYYLMIKYSGKTHIKKIIKQ